jgi:SsrA-binding protein
MKILQTNKKAYFNYEIIDKYVAGVVLMGTEVKSIRNNAFSVSESYCSIIDNELFILGMHISDYKGIKYTNHPNVRNRKLLLNRKEIDKLSKSVKEKGLTIIPLSVFISDAGFIKIEIGLGRGKKTYDKKNNQKLKDLDRELSKNIN